MAERNKKNVNHKEETKEEIKEEIKEEAKEEAKEEIKEEAKEAQAESPEGKDEAKESEEKYKALNEKYMRVLAEYDNYRKRSIREKESIYPEAKADAAARFLPVMDNLERALEAETEKTPFYEGVQLVRRQLADVFKGMGVEVIPALEGEAFNPEVHNAVMHVEDDSLGENVIVQELQKGYKMGDRVLRHSMVKVAN